LEPTVINLTEFSFTVSRPKLERFMILRFYEEQKIWKTKEEEEKVRKVKSGILFLCMGGYACCYLLLYC